MTDKQRIERRLAAMFGEFLIRVGNGVGKVKEMKPDVKVGDVYTYEELLEIWCDVLQDEGEAVDRTEALAALRTLRELWPPASH